jgi:hypothetical protein
MRFLSAFLLLISSIALGSPSSGFSSYPNYGDMHWKAPVASVAALPASGNSVADARIAEDTFNVYIWNGSTWVASGGGGSVAWGSITGTLSNQTDLQSALNAKFTLPSLTAGSVLFSDGTTIAQDNANFFWDETNKRLGIGTSTPIAPVEINSGSLAGAGGTVLPITQWTTPDGNVDIIQTSKFRFADGGDWTTASTRIREFVDGTPMGYIEFNPQNGAGGMAFGGWINGEVFRFNQSGGMGINTQTPQSELDVNGGVGIGSYAGINAAPSNGLIVSGNVGIGTPAPAASLEVDGTIKFVVGTPASGNVLTSDASGNASWASPGGPFVPIAGNVGNPMTGELVVASGITSIGAPDNAIADASPGASVNIRGVNKTAGTGSGGALTDQAGNSVGGTGGERDVIAGSGLTGGQLYLQGGASSADFGGISLLIGGPGSSGGGLAILKGGLATAGNTNGGDVYVQGGGPHGTGVRGTAHLYAPITTLDIGDLDFMGHSAFHALSLTGSDSPAGTDQSAPDLAIKAGSTTGAGTSYLAFWLPASAAATGSGVNAPNRLMLMSDQYDGITADGHDFQMNPPDDLNADANPATAVDYYAGNKTAGTGAGGNFGIHGGVSSGGPGGSVVITGGNGATTSGDVFISGGNTGTPGKVNIGSSSFQWSDAASNNGVVYLDGSSFFQVSTTTPTELGYVHGVTSAIQTQLNSITSKQASASLPFSTGSLTSIVANEIIGYGKTPNALTISNLEASAAGFTCIANPVLTLIDCGTSAGACTSGTTTLGSVTLTAANTGTDGTVNVSTIAAGHYWAWQITSGTCTALNAVGTAGVTMTLQ